MSFAQQQLFYVEKREVQKHRNRKNHNQYFTPEFAVEKALSFIPGTSVQNVIDPAVGNGVFLKASSRKWKKAKLFGIDIDKEVIAALNKSNLPNSYFVSTDSLLRKTWQLPKIQQILAKGGFDLVVGNPPFSSWFQRVESRDILSNYELAKNNGDLKRSQAIEILFLEIFVKLANVAGFIVIVLPDGILSNPQYQYVREFILKNTKVLHIISLPRNIFEQTSAKTSILILRKKDETNLNYFAELHDLGKTGKVNNTLRVPGIDLTKRMDYCYCHNLQKSPLRELMDNGVVFKPLRDFVIYCKTGKTLYGEERKFSKRGVRFLHTTNIGDICVNHERDRRFVAPNSRMDFKNAHTKLNDILIARVGNGCVGKCSIVSTKIDRGIASDCIFIIRVKGISPYFVALFLKIEFAQKWFNAIKHGSAATSITKNEILSIPIPLLHRNTEKAFEKCYKKAIVKYRRDHDKRSKVHQYFEKLVKKLEVKIVNGNSF